MNETFTRICSATRTVAALRYRITYRLESRWGFPDWDSFEATLDAVNPPTGDEAELFELFRDHNGHLIHKWPHYFGPYARHLSKYREGFRLSDGSRRPLHLLEIGVAHGGSLQLWRKYFGPDAIIYGVDVDPRCRKIVDEDVTVRTGSQTDAAFMKSVIAEMGGVDVVLDDGSHRGSDTCTTFAIVFPLLTEGGLYAVEDVHTSYWPNFGLRKQSFIQMTKEVVDGMHAWYYNRPPGRVGFAKTDVSGLHIYDSMIFFDKKKRDKPVTVHVGSPSW